MPGVALCVLTWLGTAGPASLTHPGVLRAAAATAPALLTVVLGGWLAVPALLLVGGVFVVMPGPS